MDDLGRQPPPKQDIAQMIRDHAKLWMALASNAADLAHARRQVFLAYVAEGFTEAQALDLIKGL